MSTTEIIIPNKIITLEMGTARMAELNALPKKDRAELAWLRTELARLRADNEQLKADVTRETTVCDTACMEAQRLRAEVERLTKRIADDNKAYGCELRDPNGTIWEQAAKDHARAARAEAALAEAVDGEIDGGSIPDTLLVVHVPRSPVGYRVGQPVKVILPAIDAATKP